MKTELDNDRAFEIEAPQEKPTPTEDEDEDMFSIMYTIMKLISENPTVNACIFYFDIFMMFIVSVYAFYLVLKPVPLPRNNLVKM